MIQHSANSLGRVLLKSSMKNSDVNDAELPSPVGDKTGFAELEVW